MWQKTEEEGEVLHFNWFSDKEQEAFVGAAIKKKHCKGAKIHRNKKEQKNATKSQFLLQVNVFEKFQWDYWGFMWDTQDK